MTSLGQQTWPTDANHGGMTDARKSAPWQQLPAWFDAIEVVNGDHTDLEDGYIARDDERPGLALLGGSDAHSSQGVGRVLTVFQGQVLGVAHVVEEIRARTTAPLDLRQTA